MADEAVGGITAGAENVARLRCYLEALAAHGEPLPQRNRRVNVSAIALACGFDRQVLYKNPGAKALLARAVADLGIAGDDKGSGLEPAPPDRRDRRIHRLEQENAALRGEVAGLRHKLRRLERVEEHMTETGKYVTRLFPSLGETGA